MKIGTLVIVSGPEGSAQLGKTGIIVNFDPELPEDAEVTPDMIAVVQLDDEARARNFRVHNLQIKE